MHDLDVIILKNERAAGREAAHASIDGKPGNIPLPNPYTPEWAAFWAEYRAVLSAEAGR